jgi:pimeloyl-ACP methyl ester carboxylesterase
VPTIELPQGRLHYRVAGRGDPGTPPVVFVHGLLVNAELWSGVAWSLAEQGVRSYALEMPLGAHPEALAPDADLSPRGLGRLISDALAALDLHDVTLVGNDTGGALCQFAIDVDPSRIGRLVLTNCDAFEQFPPPPFGLLIALARRPGLLRGFFRPAVRARWIRHSKLGYGGLSGKPLDAGLTSRWAAPLLADRALAVDVSRFAAALDKQDLVDVGDRLEGFAKPVLLIWGDGDPFFRVELAERLRDAFPDARLVRVRDGRTFVPLDEPERVAGEISAFTVSAV